MNGKFKLKKENQTEQKTVLIDYNEMTKKEIIAMFPNLDASMTKKELIKIIENV